MKTILLLSLIMLSLLLTSCETTVVERRHYPSRSVAYVEHDDYYRRSHRYDDHYRNDVVVDRPGYRRNTVVINPRPAYRPNVEVRYYNDARGRYYFRGSRRIYVNSGVYY